MLVPKYQGRSQCAGQVTVLRNQDGFFEALFEGCDQGTVFSGSPLEENHVADTAFRGHLQKIIFPYRMQYRGQHVIRIPVFR